MCFLNKRETLINEGELMHYNCSRDPQFCWQGKFQITLIPAPHTEMPNSLHPYEKSALNKCEPEKHQLTINACKKHDQKHF